jgi:dihydrofolate reductase
VHSEPKGNVKIPAFDSAVWQETAREDHEARNDNPAFSFVTLRRKAR